MTRPYNNPHDQWIADQEARARLHARTAAEYEGNPGRTSWRVLAWVAVVVALAAVMTEVIL